MRAQGKVTGDYPCSLPSALCHLLSGCPFRRYNPPDLGRTPTHSYLSSFWTLSGPFFIILRVVYQFNLVATPQSLYRPPALSWSTPFRAPEEPDGHESAAAAGASVTPWPLARREERRSRQAGHDGTDSRRRRLTTPLLREHPSTSTVPTPLSQGRQLRRTLRPRRTRTRTAGRRLSRAR